MGMNDVHSLSHSKWNCKYHIVFAPKYRRKVFFGEKGNRENTEATMRMERCEYSRSRGMPRSHTHAGGNTAKVFGIGIYGISEREKQRDAL